MEANEITLRLPDHLEVQARKIQSENTDKGLYAGEIEFVLNRGYIKKNDPIQGNKVKVPIDKTCPKHIWEEVLGRYKHEFTSAQGRDITAVLRSLDEWECIGRKDFEGYGKQTVFVRKLTDGRDR